MTQIPPVEKLDPEIYERLQITIHEVVEKTVPKYKEWVKSALREKITTDDRVDGRSTATDYSHVNDIPVQIKGSVVSIQGIDKIVFSAIDKEMTGIIRQALEENEQLGIMKNWFKKKFYDDVSDIQPENRAYYKHYVYNFVTHFFSKEKVAGKRILDFGCGPGFYSAILAQRGAYVTGIDKSPFLIHKANELRQKLRLANVDFVEGDFLVFAKNFGTEEFDYVVAIDAVVSFDFSRQEHNHEEFTQALSKINRILKDEGRFFIIEAHPFFGELARGIISSDGRRFRVHLPHYKIEYKRKDNPNHWFTLDEMTKALSENRMAILRIYEPDPSAELEKENPQLYKFFLKYPHMIVYEICKT